MFGRNAPPLLISTVVHVALLGAMGFYKISLENQQDVVSVETVIADERDQQEFEQDMSLDTTVSDNLSMQSGGMVTTAIGSASAQPISQTKIEKSEALTDPDIKVTTISDISIPGIGELGVDLGEGEVSGEVGARVEGYGAAMSRITAELTRMMRKQPVLVVWLFDASNSLKDDRTEISANFQKIYEELKIAKEQASQKGQKYSPLETMICSFGADIKKLLPKPTDDIDAIKKSILAVEEDASGKETTFASISKIIDEYAATAARSDRKLAIIVVSDESGDDGDGLEDIIAKTEKFKTPVYFMGREAIFGYPYAHIRWVDPEFKLTHWIRVDRGPETAFPECLQYDGFHGRWDSASSGFGPYSQVRLSKKSGGIFFMLSGNEADLAGRQSAEQRKFDDLAMKEYEPLLLAKRDYEKGRNSSDFRTTLWQVIVALNPHLNQRINLARWHYPIGDTEFDEFAKGQFERCVYSMQQLNEGIKRLEKVAPLRAAEREPRWRAAYDLAYAQLLAFRVRQFQFLLALDKHAKENPKPKDPKSNEWRIHHVGTLLPPDEQQVKATKTDMQELDAQLKKAMEMYAQVIKEHPGTPWAQRANAEKNDGFGIAFHDYFEDPKYKDPEYQKRIPKF